MERVRVRGAWGQRSTIRAGADEGMAHARPFRFGVFGEGARTPAALLGTARRAEELGFATFLIRDHFSYYVVLDHAMEEVAPIVARLAGR
jgi:alkanesulfonate monooxygenase SsuD/methylene tetrahydromethanopterin reductase-like flavin-dependent oxidoreductase (luciferase family)